MSQQEATLTTETIRYYVDSLTFGYGREYAYVKRITHVLRAGDTSKVTSHDWRCATTDYHTDVDERLEQLYQFHNESGALRMPVKRGVKCLAD